MIFQDLDATLNPKMRIRDILKEAIRVYHPLSDAEDISIQAQVVNLLKDLQRNTLF